MKTDLFATDDPYSLWVANPGPATAGGVLKQLDPVINRAIDAYGSGGSKQLLRGQAKGILLKALPRFDPSRTSLESFASNHLQGLRRLAVQQGQAIRLPEKLMLDNLTLKEAERALEDSLGRSPTDDEVLDYTKMSPRRLKHVRSIKLEIPEGQTELFSEHSEPGALPAVVDDTDDEIWNQFVTASLQPEDQLIFQHTLGLNGRKKLSTQQLAAKLGVSSSAISQRKKRIQKLWDTRFASGM